jgi:hypothetical protein
MWETILLFLFLGNLVPGCTYLGLYSNYVINIVWPYPVYNHSNIAVGPLIDHEAFVQNTSFSYGIPLAFIFLVSSLVYGYVFCHQVCCKRVHVSATGERPKEEDVRKQQESLLAYWDQTIPRDNMLYIWGMLVRFFSYPMLGAILVNAIADKSITGFLMTMVLCEFFNILLFSADASLHLVFTTDLLVVGFKQDLALISIFLLWILCLVFYLYPMFGSIHTPGTNIPSNIYIPFILYVFMLLFETIRFTINVSYVFLRLKNRLDNRGAKLIYTFGQILSQTILVVIQISVFALLFQSMSNGIVTGI